MHPVKAVSILSQLAFLTPQDATNFTNAWVGKYGPVPDLNPIQPYTPQFTDFTYASNFHTQPANADAFLTTWSFYDDGDYLYYPQSVDRLSPYESTLFYMTRDEAVLKVLAKSNVQIRTTKSLQTLQEKIEAHRAAAPFATRLKDLQIKVGNAHAIAKNLEQSRFPLGSLMANYTYQTWYDLGIDAENWPPEIILDIRHYNNSPEEVEANSAAIQARERADKAEANLWWYIAEQEYEAFHVFKPHIKKTLATNRNNKIHKFVSQSCSLSLDDMANRLEPVATPSATTATHQVSPEPEPEPETETEPIRFPFEYPFVGPLNGKLI